MKSTILVTGYKNFELGIFQDKDPRITIIKRLLIRILDASWKMEQTGLFLWEI